MQGPIPTARIYMPARNAMQSGRGRTHEWILEFEPGEKQRIDPLMGWSGSGDTRGQVRLRFNTKEDAIAYAEAHGLPYDVEEPKPMRIRAKVYADNFRYGRTDNWTH